MLALAIDIGTTNIAASLVDAGKKNVLCTISLPNSQKKFGFDVITRLHVARIRGQHMMQAIMIKDINRIIGIIDNKHKNARRDIRAIYVAANTVMLHFLFGIDASGLAHAPFRSQLPRIASANARKIGLKIGKKVMVESLPIVSPFIGADLVAGLYGSGSIGQKDIVFIDLGTNAEIAVMSKKGIFAASAAAGPAFKSSRIPLGSELIAKVSEILSKKDIDRSGRISDKSDIEQRDIRSLQVAKAAVNSAVKVLLNAANIENNAVKEVRITGIFGEKMKIRDIINIKLLPAIGKAKIKVIGGAVLSGVERMIIEKRRPKDLLPLSETIRTVELNKDASFQELFIKAMKF